MSWHELKTWPVYFEDIANGSKRFAVRLNDRNYAVGDVLRLREWNPDPVHGGGSYTGREVLARVVYILDDHDAIGRKALANGYAVLGLWILNLPASGGAARITAERARQVEVEGYYADADDKYTEGELVRGAMAYLVATKTAYPEATYASALWPWKADTFKPKDAIRNLEKAGAMISAEIDRLIRRQSYGLPVEEDGDGK